MDVEIVTDINGVKFAVEKLNKRNNIVGSSVEYKHLQKLIQVKNNYLINRAISVIVNY
jgi:hypothetical protein